ncbi:MAG: hypothetical protein IKW17_02790 [Paludibacteraceae bacterium]|nr:hypothetical protein [Paludibacteraceae bacterium]
MASFLDYSGLQLFWNKLKEIFIALHAKIASLEETIKDYSNGVIRVTYSELKQLRDNSALSPGTWYRITDYDTTVYNNANARVAGHPFDILVMATDVNQLSEDAKAVHSARDTEGYFANSNLASWKLKYSLDNDSAKFAWASDGGEKWTVTLPELGAMDLTPVSTDDSTYEGFPYKFTSNVQGMAVEVYFAHLELQEGEEFIPNIIYIAAMGQVMTNQFPVMEIVHEEQTPGKGVIWEMEDEYNNLCCYDFKNVQFKRSLIIATKEDPSEDECAFYGKYVGQAMEELPALPEGYAIDPNDSKYLYTFSVIGADGNVEDNSLGVDLTSAGMGIIHLCGLNQIKANVNQSSFAVDLNNIVFVSTCNSIEDIMNLIQIGNTFGTLCMGNTFVNGAMENIFGNYCSYNTFGNGCSGNSFGNGCDSNSFGNYFQNNSFGNYCYRNSFGNDCNYNSFGNSCDSNSFGNSCNYNSFGNSCWNNSFGNDCDYNSFGNDCSGNSFGNYCYENSFGNYFQNNSFGNDCNYNSFGNSCDNNSFGNGCDSNSFGNDCYRNSFGNYCIYNSFGNYCYHNSFGNYFQNNSFGNGCQYNDILDNVQYITVFEGVKYVSVGSTSGTVQYAQILNGTSGSSSSNKLQINFATGKNYTQVAGKNSSGQLKIWVPADMVPAA